MTSIRQDVPDAGTVRPYAPAPGRALTRYTPDSDATQQQQPHGTGSSRGGRSQRHAIASSAREGLRFADSIGAFGILFLIAFIASGAHEGEVASFLEARVTVRNALLLGVLVTAWPVAFSIAGLYDARPRARRSPRHLLRVPLATMAGAAIVLLFPLTRDDSTFGYGAVATFWLASTAWSLLLRMLPSAIGRFAHSSSTQRILIIGTGPRAARLAEHLAHDAPGQFELVGYVDSPEYARRTAARHHLLGAVPELESILMRETVDEVFIALPVQSCYAAIQQAIRTCERVGVQSKHLADIFHSSLVGARIENSGSQPVVAMKVVHDDARLLVKRAVDILGAAIGLVVLAPVFAAIAIAIKWTSRGPVFFAQERFGFRRRRFRMLKFRTMVTDAEARMAEIEHLNEASGPIFKIRRDPRITPVGGFLRRTSLDELPQLWNVLVGEMSLVGPRPMSVRDVSRFDEAWLLRRFSVRPGLTCLWQVGGRSQLTFEQWMELDMKYIDGWSLNLDARILLRTVPAVLRGVGAV